MNVWKGFLIFIIIIAAQSCSIEKRLYNKGFHVENNFFKKEKLERVEIQINGDNLLASNSCQIIESDTIKCDTIIRTDGKKITVKNLKLNPTKIKAEFKNCKTNKRGVAKHKKVEKIVLADGSEVKMELTEEEINSFNEKYRLKNIFGFLSAVSSIIFFLATINNIAIISFFVILLMFFFLSLVLTIYFSLSSHGFYLHYGSILHQIFNYFSRIILILFLLLVAMNTLGAWILNFV